MSIKKLFEASDKSLNYLSEKNQKDAFKSVESAQNLEQLSIDQKRYVPQVDYSDPANFARYGSARLYYKSAFNRILDYYPYDGSDAEINKFFNGCLDVEKYLLEKKYPRTNGYIKLAADGYTVSSVKSGYGIPTTNEYIDLKGGPGTGSAKSSKLKDLLPNDKSDSYDNSNIYDKNIYQTAGLPSDYGKGTRTSNLRSNFDDGVTVEFWFKSGSIPVWRSKTKKQVVFDLWNQRPLGAQSYGRLRIELTGAFDASGETSTSLKAPFVVHVASGSKPSKNINSASLGTTGLWSKMGDWNHYAITMQNTGSKMGIKLYVNGALDDHITTAGRLGVSHDLPSINPIGEKNLVARIGALRTRTSASADTVSGAGKLSGSLDEFRFWKVARTPKQIGEKWFTQVRGGSNNDISNATLGVYYKFNEGITGKTSTDKVVLDYAGRVTNGKWTGYTANSRFTGSAIVLSKAAQKEYLDPIVRTNNPKVMNLETQLEFTGSSHDYDNHTSVLSLVPGWILDQHSEVENTDLTYITHIMGAYFDKLYLQISEIPKLRQLNYVSSSNKPISFAKHLPQSLGLYSPDLFIDSTVMEKFSNRDTNSLFENDLHNTKNLIYINLYNNLTDIFKSKGTERSIKNIFKCFNIDENLLRLTVNSNNEEFVLRDNLRQQLLENSFLNFNKRENAAGVVYQRSSSISGLNALTVSGSIPGSPKQKPFGFTSEANVILPYFDHRKTAFGRNPRFVTCSIFGSVTVKSGSQASIRGTNLNKVRWENDYANFHVYTVKDEVGSRNARFMLSASLHDSVNEDAMSVVLTSSLFLNAYDNEPWNLSVRVKPVDYPNAYFVTTGSSASNREKYEIIFTGINPRNADVANSFTVKKELPTQIGRRLIETSKRLYVGAERKNVIGELKSRSDVLVSSLTFWTKYLEKNNLHKHALDFENVGISGSNEPIAANVAVTSGSLNQNILNRDMLALHWNFNNVTASSAGGNFTVQDFSSGSIWRKGTGVTQTGDYGSAGWAGKISQKRYPGYAYGFDLSSTDVVDKRQINKYKFINPEQAVSSDMVQIFSDEDVMFPNLRREEIVPNYVYSIEKSIYNAISEEMLDFFAGVTDFHNLIGAPVNRYRQDYKEIEKLRNVFFRRVKNVAHVESYMEYYKWFDDALSEIISQLIPLSSEFVEDVLNVVESHVLERNKYQSRMNVIDTETMAPKPETFISVPGTGEVNISAMLVPPPTSPRPTNKNITFWLKRALRGSSEITSNNATVDSQRDKIRDIIYSAPHYSGSKKIKVYTEDLKSYDYEKYGQRNLMKTVNMSVDVPHQSNQSKNKQIQKVRGGVNFPPTKNIEFTMNALRPAGPVNTDNNMFVPENVMLAFTKEAIPVKNFKTASLPREFIKKERRVFKVNHGRNWDDGLSYSNVKSTVAFPFNIFSSSNKTGYNKAVIKQANLGIQITNLHNDVYGDLMEVPMQGPFTDNVVGGLQARHIDINLGNDKPNTRPEAWRILLGTCTGAPNPTGAIGMVGPDYPPPSLQVAAGERGYPYAPYQKAYLYRDMTAKRPVNIKNINVKNAAKTKTVAGNYQNNYEVIHSFGSYDNPRAFIENQPVLPKQLEEVKHTTNVRTLLDVHRGEENHFKFVDDYNAGYLTGATNRTIITNQFSAPGGIETMTRGYLDFKSDSYSPYNCLSFRNLRVLKPWQGPSGTFSQPAGGTPSTSRVFDIHGKDYGLNSHLARHTARFGRDSLQVSELVIGASYDQLPAMFKTNRNPKQIVRITNTTLTEANEIAKPLTNTKALSFGWGGHNDNRSNSLIKSGAFSTDFPNGITISLWMYRHHTSNNGQFRGLVTLGDDHTNGANMPNGYPTIGLFVSTDYKPYFKVDHVGGTDGNWTLGNSLSTGAWNHIAVTYNGTNTANKPTFYINGVSQSLNSSQQPSTTMPAVTSKVPGHSRIGASYQGPDGYRVISGSTLDEISIHNIPLTAADITKIYCNGKVVNLTSSYAPATASLVTWLRLGDASTAPSNNSQLTSSGATNLARNFPPASKSVFFDVKGNNNFAIRAGTTERSNMNYNALNTVTPPAGCTGGLYYKETNTYTSNSLQYDNWYIQHQIPRASRQYLWLDRSIEKVSDLKYSGYQNTSRASMMPYRSSSAPGGLESFYNIVSASQATINDYYQPINRLNIVIDDPVSSSTNTLGYPETQDTNRYFNRSLIGALSNTNAHKRTWYLNNLLSQRQATYGWGWQKFRQRDSKILIKEYKENKLSTVESANSPIVRYDLPPVSFKGRPAHVCIGTSRPSRTKAGGKRVVNNTYKITSTNEKIFFNERKLNNLTNVGINKPYSPLKYLLNYTRTPGRNLNWVLYTQNVFPSARNESLSQSTRRLGYDNKFWRNTLDDRIIVGDTFNNSFNIDVKQSAWVLDAPVNFLTRSRIISNVDNFNKNETKAGELQNTYFAYLTCPGNNSTGQNMFPGALYARKHALGSPRSVVSPQGPVAPGIWKKAITASFKSANQIDILGGEALWEADIQAGTMHNSIFRVTASSPWYNNYTSFNADLKLKSRGYSIVPEYRISEHVEDYYKYGLSNQYKQNTFSIPGTQFSSSQKDFYLDYSNTDFLDFLGIKSETLLDASEIRLNCNAAIKYNPYKGFYPAQRTQQLVKQFKNSFENTIAIKSKYATYYGANAFSGVGGLLKPLFDPLFAPGILFNSIKSGIAVDYPIIMDPDKITREYFYGGNGSSGPGTPLNNYAATITGSTILKQAANGYYGGQWWDQRLPFETMVNPRQHIVDLGLIDMESHPSMSLAIKRTPSTNFVEIVTGSMNDMGDDIYSLMARNFFAGVGEFFLEGAGYTQLKSQTVATDLKFKKGEVYMSRIKLRRSHNGKRMYDKEMDSFGNAPYGGLSKSYYTRYGARATNKNGRKTRSGYPIPQDPTGSAFKETFTMYSRPTAFGPSFAGRPTGAHAAKNPFRRVAKDSFSGYNPAFTPPYQNGEAWIDLIFKPSASVSYDLEKILAETDTMCWRFDPGYSIPRSGADSAQPALIPVWSAASSSKPNAITPAGDKTIPSVYDGYRINVNSMQATASLNIFGVERVFQQKYGVNGQVIDTTNNTVGARWIIQPKFETPMLNFNNTGPRPISVSEGTLTLPQYASSSTARGMWHQFGTIPDKAETGVFMEIGDIPTQWLKNHYLINQKNSLYNNYNTGSGPGLHKKVKSLSSLCGFDRGNSSKRLGNLKEKFIVKEAVVAIPYTLENLEPTIAADTPSDSPVWKTKKKFIGINPARVGDMYGSQGSPLVTQGQSIAKLKAKMAQYVFPPEFDFLHNQNIDPFAMYVFEFKYEFDRDDLSYVWQNIAPRNYEKISFQSDYCSHKLDNSELINREMLMQKNLRWMIFKVKQRARADYYDLIPDQAGAATSQIVNKDKNAKEYQIRYNWPYDYLSFVELIKMDVDILLKKASNLEDG